MQLSPLELLISLRLTPTRAAIVDVGCKLRHPDLDWGAIALCRFFHRKNMKRLTLLVHAAELSAAERALSSHTIDVLHVRQDPADGRLRGSGSTSLEFQRCVADAKQLLQAAGASADGAEAHRTTRLVVNANSGLLPNSWAMDLLISGWHLKERFLDPETQSKRPPSHMLWGCSVHCVESAIRAAELGVDYMHVGTMFPTATHPDKRVLEGPELLHAIRKALLSRSDTLPVLMAVGGIKNESTIRAVLDAGAVGIVVRQAILAAEDPCQAALAIRKVLDDIC